MGMPAASADLATRSRVGLNPTRPQQAAGIRIEPPPSLACAIGRAPAATSAADPPDDAPAGSRCSTDCASGTVHIFGGRGQTEGRQGRRTEDVDAGREQLVGERLVVPGRNRRHRRRSVLRGDPREVRVVLDHGRHAAQQPVGQVTVRGSGEPALQSSCATADNCGSTASIRASAARAASSAENCPAFNRLGDAPASKSPRQSSSNALTLLMAADATRTAWSDRCGSTNDKHNQVSKNHAPETIRRRGRVPRRDATFSPRRFRRHP